jgi:hypothetical protein
VRRCDIPFSLPRRLLEYFDLSDYEPRPKDGDDDDVDAARSTNASAAAASAAIGVDGSALELKPQSPPAYGGYGEQAYAMCRCSLMSLTCLRAQFAEQGRCRLCDIVVGGVVTCVAAGALRHVADWLCRQHTVAAASCASTLLLVLGECLTCECSHCECLCHAYHHRRHLRRMHCLDLAAIKVHRRRRHKRVRARTIQKKARSDVSSDKRRFR